MDHVEFKRRVHWLPEPMLRTEAEVAASGDDSIYHSFHELYGNRDTTEADRPSMQSAAGQKDAAKLDKQHAKSFRLPNMEGTIRCTSCGKHRAVFVKHGCSKLTSQQLQVLQDIRESEFDKYTCGAPLFCTESMHPLSKHVLVRTNATCSTPTLQEVYAQFESCARCGDSPTTTEPLVYNENIQDLGYKWVAPICAWCHAQGMPHPREKKRATYISIGIMNRSRRHDSRTSNEARPLKRRRHQPADFEQAVIRDDMPRAERSVTGGFQTAGRSVNTVHDSDDEEDSDSDNKSDEDVHDDLPPIPLDDTSSDDDNAVLKRAIEYEGFVVGARLQHTTSEVEVSNTTPQLQYLIHWEGYGPHMCTYEPCANWICDATEMELGPKTKFMLVYCGSLRKCKYLRTIDADHVQLEWCRLPQASMEKEFKLHLRDMREGVTEWSLHGYDVGA